MSSFRLSRAWVLAVAAVLGGCDALESEQELAFEREQKEQRDAARRFSAIDGRFEKADEKHRKMIDVLINAEHPVNPKENDSYHLGVFRNNLVLKNADAERLLQDVKSRLKKDAAAGFSVPFNALEGCVHLQTYHSKPIISADALNDLLWAMSKVDEYKKVKDKAFPTKVYLYGAFGQNRFSDIAHANTVMDVYEAKAIAAEKVLADAEADVAKSKGPLTQAFLVMWDKSITLDLGMDNCRADFARYKNAAALHGIVPK